MTQPQFISPPQQATAPAPPPRPTLRQLIAESGASGKYFPFLNIGDTIEGRVVDVKILQSRDLQTKELQFWQSGDPKWNVVPTLETNLRDPAEPEDDGLRSIYVKWSGAQRMALQQALNQAGVDDIIVGGYLKATYVGLGPAQKGMNPPKLMEFHFTPPVQKAGLTALPQGPAIPAQNAPVTPPYPQGYNTPAQVQQPANGTAGYTYGGVVAPPTSYPPGIVVQGQPGLFTPPQPPAQQYPPPGTPRPPAPQPPAPPTPVPAPVPVASPGDLAAQFAQIKAGLDAGMSPAQIVLMVPGVDMATVQAIAAAPSQ